MEDKNLKSKTISSMLWSALGRFGTIGITFIANVVLAHLLTPKDFGCIGMLQIFISVSEVFVLGGFGAALIQKRNPTHIDYTTVFYWNLFVAILMYVLLYYSAPYIARFYEMPLLCDVLRVQSIVVLISAFSFVQTTQLQKRLRFREISIRGVTAALAGVSVSIVMAFMGFGIWSLVTLHIVVSITSVLLLWRMSEWRPTLEFSWQSFKSLFPFGSLIAASSLVETLYTNIQGLIIGKWYTPQDMGYYSQARKLEQVPTSALSAIVGQVVFPVFSMLNDNKEKLKDSLRKSIKSISFLCFPICALLIVIGRPLIRLLYGSQWDNSVLYFQILCLSGMAYIINCMNLNVIKSLGRGKVYFIMQTTKRLIGICLIIIGMTFGVVGIVCSITVTFYVDFIINSFVVNKLLGYGIVNQVSDVKGIYAVAFSIGLLLYILGIYIPLHQYVVMIIQIVVYVFSYLWISKLFKIEGYFLYRDIINRYINKKLWN